MTKELNNDVGDEALCSICGNELSEDEQSDGICEQCLEEDINDDYQYYVDTFSGYDD